MIWSSKRFVIIVLCVVLLLVSTPVYMILFANNAVDYITGKKDERKIYQTYTGYRSGLKETTPQKLRESDPTRIIKSAVWGMLPHGRLGRAQFRKLKVYAGAEYPQVAQKPVKVTVEK